MKIPYPKNRTSVVLWSAFAVITAAVIILKLVPLRKKELPVIQETSVAVRTQVMKEREISDTILLPGHLTPSTDTILSAERPGRIVEMLVDKGSSVKPGQPLLKIDNRHALIAVQQAEIQSTEAEKEFKRWDELRTKGAVSASEFEKIETRRDLSALALKQTQVYLSQSEVLSPSSGIVDDRYIDVGEYISEGTPALRIVNIDKLKLVFDIPEKNVMSLKAGDEISFSLSAIPGETFSGSVIFVSPAASSENNAFPAEAMVDNPGHRIKAGMIANVYLIKNVEKKALVLPLSTVIPKRGEQVVFVVEDGHAVRRVVRIDRFIDQEVVISSGLKPGDNVVVEGHRVLDDGVPVDVME